MWNAIRTNTEHLAELGLTDKQAVAQTLYEAAVSNHNRNPSVIIAQQAALMVAEFNNGSIEYVKGEENHEEL